jgi:uncharacterized membrane protein YvbJ
MKYCSHCGAEVHDDAIVCLKCGCSVTSVSQQTVSIVNPNDASSGGFAALGFFFPILGLILWLIWNNTSPLKAKSCGMGALTGFIVSIVISILAAVIGGAAIASVLSGYF